MAVLLFFLYGVQFAVARDGGQWEQTDPEVRQWYRSLMQPDNPSVSCCGEADAYWCDEIHVKDSKTFCNITDDRDNEKLRRTPVPIGTEIEIPDRKLTWKYGNPTGHSVVFLSSGGSVYCFVQGGGV
ncbi:hypothetical protein [Bradyrhizobium sp.]|uniref:hypothetical protein n=1 Tax=Bradyrhizobium sp. TaxID=376 RepID=UPI002D5F3BD5|nr:hypothetical protein [Bradyrhizobium sp.]HZR77350.1 hypothetical protein [Bradyrhizobium sp.]